MILVISIGFLTLLVPIMMKSCLSVACRPAVRCITGKNLMLPGQLCHLGMDHGNKIKPKLDFIFTKFTEFTKELFFTIFKHNFLPLPIYRHAGLMPNSH